MSNESYARGFVKKAQECGVNPNDLIDFIKKSADQDAFDERVQDAMKNISDYVEKHPVRSGALAGGLSSVASGANAGRALGGSVGGVAGSALSPVGALVGGIHGSSTDIGSGAGASAGSAGTVAGGAAIGGAIGNVLGAVAGSSLAPVGSAVGASAGSSGATRRFADMVNRERANFHRIREERKKAIEEQKKMLNAYQKYPDSVPRYIRQGDTNRIGRVDGSSGDAVKRFIDMVEREQSNQNSRVTDIYNEWLMRQHKERDKERYLPINAINSRQRRMLSPLKI